jgi:hypothetical protein
MDVKLAISAYGMMSWLLTPNAAPAVGLSVDARGEVISVGGELRAVLPSRVLMTERLPGATSSYPVEMDVSQVSLLLVPCTRWRYFVGCGVAQAGLFLYQTSAATEQGLVFGLGPRVGFEVPFAQRFAVFGFAEALFSIYKQGVEASDPPVGQPNGPIANVFWDPPIGAAFFGAGVSVRFE